MITVKDEKGHSQVWPATPGNQLRARVRIQKILARLTPGQKVLELGCGHGELTAALVALGCSVTAVDRSPQMLEQTLAACKTDVQLQLIQAEVLDYLETTTEKFDAVVGMGILHHCVGDLDVTLSWVAQCLNAHGQGLFWEPNRDNPLVRFIFGTTLGRRMLALEEAEDAFSRRDIFPLLKKYFLNSDVTTEDWAYPFMPVGLQPAARWTENRAPRFLQTHLAQSLWVEFSQSRLEATTESPK